MNNYHKDSEVFFKEVAKQVDEALDNNKVIQLVMNLALGCERLLKGILYDINPTYILTDPNFKNSVQVLYKKHLLPEKDKSPELSKEIIGDVITFKNSLLRAQLVSDTTKQHKQILFAISAARDIIAHCELKDLNIPQMREILQRDFFPMLKQFAKELGHKPNNYFDGNQVRLSKISIAHQSDLKIKIHMSLEHHLELWEKSKKVPGYTEKRKKVTGIMLKPENRGKTQCPSCHQDAVVYFTPVIEMDMAVMAQLVIGYQVKKLTCFYCNLQVTDAPTLDQLGIKYDKVEHACLYCGKITPNISSVCDTCNDTDFEQIGLF